MLNRQNIEYLSYQNLSQTEPRFCRHMCMMHITIRWGLLLSSNSTAHNFSFESHTMSCCLFSPVPSPPNQCCTCHSPPDCSHLHPCICLQTQIRTAHTPVSAPSTAMKMWTRVGVGK